MKKADIINKVYELELSKRATLVVFYLINRADSELTCFPGIKTIARECNMSTRTVQRALGDLEEVGLVRKESRFHEQGGQRSNLYYLQEPEADIDDEIAEIDFEEYREEEEAKVIDKNFKKMDNLLFENDCRGGLQFASKASYYLLDKCIKPLVSWGDSHYVGP